MTSTAVATESAVGQLSAPAVVRLVSPLKRHAALIGICVLGVALAARGITNESAVSLEGDMPHYLLNGLFLHDLVRDTPFRAPLQYAQRYYAQYPALTLGHHPFVPAIAEVPFFFLFGVSTFSARLTTLCAFVVLLGCGFGLIRRTYDATTATLASLLLISSAGIVPLFQVVLSEPSTLCLIAASAYLLHRYGESERPWFAVGFAICAVLSVYAKQLAVFMFPVYLFQFVSAFGVRRLFRRSTIVTSMLMAICILPLVPLTLKYSHWNVTIVSQFVQLDDRTSGSTALVFVRWLWGGQFRVSIPVLVLAGVALVAAALRRDRRILLFGVWGLSAYVGLFLMGVMNDRFFCYWVPPFCALAAAAVQIGKSRLGRLAWTTVVLVVAGYQFAAAAEDAQKPVSGGVRPAGAQGYEAAARYVTENPRGDTILYSAAVDTGYFVFFVRKADSGRQRLVLRADKILTTSRMRIADFERRIGRPDEILPILRRYGVGYVVLEDRAYPDGPLRWLQEIVRTEDFVLRRRIPIASSDLRLTAATLSIYEFQHATHADASATLDIGVPLMNGAVAVRLADLIRR